MKALQMSDSKPRYAMTKLASKARKSAFWGPVGLLSLNEVVPPELPGKEWVRVRTRYSGICGSDIGSITLKASTSTTVFTSFPFTLGHENTGVIGEIGDEAGDLQAGQRVVVNPLLPCVTRSIDQPCAMCQAGKPNLCQNFDQGALSAGVMIGFCRDTGGAWSAEFVAHRSQVQVVPDGLTDEEAVLAEPFATALHPVIQDIPGNDDQVLIIGSGIIGLSTIAAIRALGSSARIIVSSRHAFQSLAARKLGADVVLNASGGELEQRLVEELGARSLTPVLGDDVIVGGADYVYDCVGSSESLSSAIRLAGPGGQVVIIGLAGTPKGVDFTPVWMNELTLRGDFCYAPAKYQGQQLDPIALAMRLMADKQADLGWLVTHRFEVDDYKDALATVGGKGESGVIKAVFEFDPSAINEATTSAPAE